MWSKGNDVTTKMEKSPISFYHGVAFMLQIDQSSPSVTQDKEICQVIKNISLGDQQSHYLQVFQSLN